jgi:translation initiation factor 3 subunit H
MENVNYQFSYQASEELSDNCVVIMYDPIQSKNGNLLLKAFRLSDRFMEIRRRKSNEFLKPSDILVELPVKIKNNGHVSAFLRCLSDTHASDIDCNFEPLSLSGSDGFTEQSFDVITHVIDDLLHEQTRFQLYSKGTSKLRQEYVKWLNRRVQENNERKENGENQLPIDFQGLKPIPDAPQRGETLLVLGQLERYCKQIKDHVDSSYHKLIVTSQLNSASKVDK